MAFSCSHILRLPSIEAVSFLSNEFRTSCTVFISSVISLLFFLERLMRRSSNAYLVKRRHRFIGTADLHLVKRGLYAVAVAWRTLHFRLVGIVPRSRPTKHIFLFNLWEDLAREERFLDGVLICAGSALKRISACGRHPREDEDVGAIWTNFFLKIEWVNTLFDLKKNLGIQWDLQRRGIF